jgi:cytochrome c-type biogenesis protein CcmE
MNNKRNFVIAGVLILAAVAYLIVSSTGTTASFFLTIEELQAMGAEAQGRNLTVSGAVLGETIVYDAGIPRATFTIVQIPGDPKEIEAQGGLEQVLAVAADNPDLPSLDIVYDGARPDLLRDEAQAIARGQLHDDGVFYAEELLLKCPSRYAEDVPEQTED